MNPGDRIADAPIEPGTGLLALLVIILFLILTQRKS